MINVRINCYCFLQLTWTKLFAASSRDHGTLGHFCSLLRRLPAAKKPKNDMNACVDVLFTVLKGHYIASACEMLGISKADEIPKDLTIPNDKEGRIKFIAKLSRQVAEKCSIMSEPLLRKPVSPTNDGVYDYASTFCHYASLAYEFRDAWAEGDGERICLCWKVFLMHFYSAKRTKYAWEALKLQFQLAVLPPSLSHQVKWGRFINTHGGVGHNIPCDLYNEHLNKVFKDILHNIGPNLTDNAIRRAARSVTTLCKIRDVFDSESKVPVQTTAHSTKDDEDDVAQVVSVLLKNNVLSIKPGRKHSQFPNIKSNPLSELDYDLMSQWIERKKNELIKLKIATGEGDLSESESDSDSTDDED